MKLLIAFVISIPFIVSLALKIKRHALARRAKTAAIQEIGSIDNGDPEGRKKLGNAMLKFFERLAERKLSVTSVTIDGERIPFEVENVRRIIELLNKKVEKEMEEEKRRQTRKD